MKEIIKILENPSPFLEQLFLNLKENNINVENYELDHICYRVKTNEKYLELKEKISKISKLLSEEMVSNRPICTFKLNEPIIFKDRKISILELPAPKENSNYENGFEHAEFVINIPFEEFIEKHKNLNFNTKGLQKQINPELGLKFKDNLAVKFHHNTLEYVVIHLQG